MPEISLWFFPGDNQATAGRIFLNATLRALTARGFAGDVNHAILTFCS